MMIAMPTRPAMRIIVPLDKLGKLDSSDSSIWKPLISPVAISTCTVAVLLRTSTSTRYRSPSRVTFLGRRADRLYPSRFRKPWASQVTRSASSRLLPASTSEDIVVLLRTFVSRGFLGVMKR